MDIRANFPQLPEDGTRKEIGRGTDSIVYRVDDYVYKVYKDGLLRPEQVEAYAELTNRVAEFVENEQAVGTIQLLGKPFTYSTEVIPVLLVDRDISMTISSYEKGVRPWSILSQSGGAGFHHDIKQFDDQKESDFFRALWKQYQQTYLGEGDNREQRFLERQQARAVIGGEMKGRSRLLNTYFGVEGVDIVSQNVKMRKAPDRDHLRLVVTDLASVVQHVRKK